MLIPVKKDSLKAKMRQLLYPKYILNFSYVFLSDFLKTY